MLQKDLSQWFLMGKKWEIASKTSVSSLSDEKNKGTTSYCYGK
jgi:hypothetical protein